MQRSKTGGQLLSQLSDEKGADTLLLSEKYTDTQSTKGFSDDTGTAAVGVTVLEGRIFSDTVKAVAPSG